MIIKTGTWLWMASVRLNSCWILCEVRGNNSWLPILPYFRSIATGVPAATSKNRQRHSLAPSTSTDFRRAYVRTYCAETWIEVQLSP